MIAVQNPPYLFERIDRNQEVFPFLFLFSLSLELYDSIKNMWIDSNQVQKMTQIKWSNRKKIEENRI